MICLIYVLAFHELNSQTPYEVYVALSPGMEEPRQYHPSIKPTTFPVRHLQRVWKYMNSTI